jgi:hypothetical protein
VSTFCEERAFSHRDSNFLREGPEPAFSSSKRSWQKCPSGMLANCRATFSAPPL